MHNNGKLALSIFWIVLGAVLLGLSVANVLDSTIYAGMGGALLAVGILQVIRNLRYRTNPSYQEKIDTEVNDERNIFLGMKSWSWTGRVIVLVECIGIIVAMVLGQQTIQLVLSYSVCAILVIYWVTFMILAKKY